MNFKVVELDSVTQRDEWLKWRHEGIGSSDAPAIIGVSRYNTPEELLKSKIEGHVEDSANAYIKNRGNKIELRVRRFLEFKYGKPFPAVNCENLDLDFLRASLDGLSGDTFIEIKLLSSFDPNKKVNTESAGYKKWVNVRDNGVIPDDYYPQIQHQFAVTGLPKCLFVGLKEVRGQDFIKFEDLAICEVPRNESYIALLTNLESNFWDKVLTGRKQSATLLKQETYV